MWTCCDVHARPSLLDLVMMQDELEAIFGRQVDLLDREANHNWIRREATRHTAQPIYRAA